MDFRSDRGPRLRALNVKLDEHLLTILCYLVAAVIKQYEPTVCWRGGCPTCLGNSLDPANAPSFRSMFVEATYRQADDFVNFGKLLHLFQEVVVDFGRARVGGQFGANSPQESTCNTSRAATRCVKNRLQGESFSPKSSARALTHDKDTSENETAHCNRLGSLKNCRNPNPNQTHFSYNPISHISTPTLLGPRLCRRSWRWLVALPATRRRCPRISPFGIPKPRTHSILSQSTRPNRYRLAAEARCRIRGRRPGRHRNRHGTGLPGS